jgi:hypothetical protein
VATIRFRSRSEFGATVDALGEACDRYRNEQGQLDAERAKMLVAIVTAFRRRTPGGGVAIDLDEEYVGLAKETLAGHPRAGLRPVARQRSACGPLGLSRPTPRSRWKPLARARSVPDAKPGGHASGPASPERLGEYQPWLRVVNPRHVVSSGRFPIRD